MKSSFLLALRKRSILNAFVSGYTVISFLNIAVFFHGSIGSEMLCTIMGNHSVLYPYWGILIAAEMESTVLVLCILFYWVTNLISLITSYIAILTKGKYRAFQIVVISDVIFSAIFILANIWYGGLLDLHLFMLLGIILNLCFWYYIRMCQRTMRHP